MPGFKPLLNAGTFIGLQQRKFKYIISTRATAAKASDKCKRLNMSHISVKKYKHE